MRKVNCMYKYTLHKKSTKHTCPKCGKKRFVLYIDNETGQYLSEKVGRCDREINCGYHHPPKQYFQNNGETYNYIINDANKLAIENLETSYHSDSDLDSSLNNYDKNQFIKFLTSKIDKVKVQKMITDYRIGTADFWNNGTIFWQIDKNNQIRGGKIIIYSTDGKRTKYINWVHSYLMKNKKVDNFNLKQCLFGEHLLSKYSKPIAIVESEKTACIMSMLFDKFLWLATGSLSGLSLSKIESLKDRKIILYPDLGIKKQNLSPFIKWKEKSIEYQKKGFDILVSNLLEQKCSQSDRKKGLDIADYFLENLNIKPRKIESKSNSNLLKMYMKNKNIKTLVEVFELTNSSGRRIKID
ncbi:DUF6371 domain-containing protein [Tenacibaculum sp. 47A_GOM-205m]|uniref:DUF6371 domain-containing protein n=1 Tax=Tenacibaculum sp. 47A_GOM-205m TaxID=1380384 RepID=UPI0006840848|nr:DUF6371 domain-containing protein [Tenacibaculum sp. 47A_GOM-205m]